jgi:ABC-type transporter Mla subunit MlaD
VIPDERLALRVGAISLGVLGAAIIFFVFVFHRIEWGSHIRVRVYMHTTGGLREGAPINCGGRQIGKVESIALAPRGAKTPLNGDEGVAITVELDAKLATRIARGGDVFVASRGPLSERYLELGPAREPGAVYADGDEVLGRDPPSLDRVLQRTWDNLTATAKFADELRPEMHALRAQLDKLVGDLRGLVDARRGELPDLAAPIAEARRAYETGLGGDAGLARARAMVDRARASVGELRGELDQLQARVDTLRAALAHAQGTIDARIPPVLDSIQVAIDRGKAVAAKIDPLLAQIADIGDRIARGEGTIGKLANDPEFPEDAKDLGKLLKRQPWRIVGHPDD